MPITNAQTTDDAKPQVASSTTPAPAAQSGVSSAVPPKEPSFAEVARKAFEQATAAEGGSKEEGSSGPKVTRTEEENQKPVGDEDATGEQESQGVEKEEGQEEVAPPQEPQTGKENNEGKEEGQEVPFHDHPRWKEVLNQRDEFKKKHAEIEQKVKEAEPKLKWYENHANFMRQYGISDQDFVNTMNFLALQRTNPAQAREILKPMWESLQSFDENYIPPEIQRLVDENEMTPDAAKMMAKLQAQVTGSQRMQHVSREQQQRNQAQSIVEAVTSWEQTKRASDPDFVPKQDNSPDGLLEMTAANYAHLNALRPASDARSAVALLEEAYGRAKATIERFLPKKPATRQTPSSSKSSAPPKKKFEDMSTDEVVAATAARHGIHWNGRSNVED
jgi:hypothetical protein